MEIHGFSFGKWYANGGCSIRHQNFTNHQQWGLKPGFFMRNSPGGYPKNSDFINPGITSPRHVDPPLKPNLLAGPQSMYCNHHFCVVGLDHLDLHLSGFTWFYMFLRRNLQCNICIWLDHHLHPGSIWPCLLWQTQHQHPLLVRFPGETSWNFRFAKLRTNAISSGYLQQIWI